MKTKPASQLDFEFVQRTINTPTRLLRGSVRGSDPIESQGAALRALDHQSWLQKELLHIIATEGPQTAKELESRARYRALGPSTVRKRLSELRHAGHIAQVEIDGEKQRREGCAVYDLAPKLSTSGVENLGGEVER